MPRGKADQNLHQRNRHRYAELSRMIAAFKRRIKRDGELPPRLEERYERFENEAKKLRPNATSY